MRRVILLGRALWELVSLAWEAWRDAEHAPSFPPFEDRYGHGAAKASDSAYFGGRWEKMRTGPGTVRTVDFVSAYPEIWSNAVYGKLKIHLDLDTETAARAAAYHQSAQIARIRALHDVLFLTKRSPTMALNAEEERRVRIRAIACKDCRFATWEFIQQPTKDAQGHDHHPACRALKAQRN